MRKTCALLLLLLPMTVSGQGPSDREAVRQAAANYVTAVYESKPELIEQERPPAADRSTGSCAQQDGTYKQGRMTYTRAARCGAQLEQGSEARYDDQ